MNSKSDRTFTDWRLGLVGVFLLSVLIYLPTMMGASTWDDALLISGSGLGNNRFLSAFTHPFLGNYFRPFTTISFALDSLYANQTPFYYHQTSILLHALTSVLVSCLAFLLTNRKLAGIAAGMFFATQPLQVGAAAWIGGRTDDLSTCFLAAFMVSLVLYHQTQTKTWLATSTVMFFFAALSKEQAVMILFAVPISVFAFGSKTYKDVRRVCIPFGVATTAYIVLWIIGGPIPATARASLVDTVTLALRTACHYGLAFIAPNRTSLLTFTLENYVGFAWIALGAIFVGAFAYLLRFAWKSHRPLAWVAICGILVYIPVSNFPPVPTYVVGPYRVAESGLAVACLMGIGVAYCFSARRYFWAAALSANLLAGTLTTWWGVHQWLSTESLFATSVKIDPHFILGVTKYAQAQESQGQIMNAVQWREKTLRWIFGSDQWFQDLDQHRMSPTNPNVLARLRTNEGIPYLYSLGWLMCNQASSFAKLKRVEEARKLDEWALGIVPKDHRINFAYGQLILNTDRKKAIHYLEAAVNLAPNEPVYAMALGHERIRDGRFTEAIQLLGKVMKVEAWNGGAWIDLADADIGVHDLSGASNALDQAQHAVFAPKKSEIELRRIRIEAIRKTWLNGSREQ